MPTQIFQTLQALRAENTALKREREDFMRVVSASLLLLRDLDLDTYESYEAAELLYELLNELPPEVIEEASAGLREFRRVA